MASNHPRNIGPMQAAAKCERIKKNGERCRGQACRGRTLCRSHGGKAGAPKGNQNALKHGFHTRKSRERDRRASALMRRAKVLLMETGYRPAVEASSIKEEKPGRTIIPGGAPGFRRRDNHELLTGLAGGGPFRFKAGESTHDTLQALVPADSLVLHPDSMRMILSRSGP